jgi:hypothetical protein
MEMIGLLVLTSKNFLNLFNFFFIFVFLTDECFDKCYQYLLLFDLIELVFNLFGNSSFFYDLTFFCFSFCLILVVEVHGTMEQ